MDQINKITLDEVTEALFKVGDFGKQHWVKIGAAVVSAYCVNSIVRSWRQKREVRARIAKHQKEVAEITRFIEESLAQGAPEKDSPEEVSLEQSRKAILELPLRSLLFKLRKGELKPTHVLQAYQSRALEATRRANCICHFLPEANKLAAELDSVPESERGPLHGLPVSIKECIDVAGYPSTAGISKFLAEPAAKDGSTVKMLKALGAVPFCKTNVGQCMKAPFSSNPIYGATVHPTDSNRTPGGSTGGEGCLLALGGSPLGLGTDVGGSVRVPAAFCGVAGIKPTLGRICQRGRRAGAKGRLVGVTSNVGLMCPSAEGLSSAFRALLDGESAAREAAKMDHEMVPLPWSEVLFLRSRRRIKIGWYDTDGVIAVTPGCKRAVREAANLLEAAGHEVIQFTPPQLPELNQLAFDFILSDDGGANTLAWMEGEVWDETLKFHRIIWQTPWVVKKWLLKKLFLLKGDRTVAQYQDFHRTPVRTKDLWLSMGRMHELVQEMLDGWNEKGIDIMLAPMFSCPAPTLKAANETTVACAMTIVYNVANFPVGSVRVTEESEEDQRNLENFQATDAFERNIKESTRGALGLPLSVQVIGRPWQEELVLGVMRDLENRRDEKDYSFVASFGKTSEN